MCNENKHDTATSSMEDAFKLELFECNGAVATLARHIPKLEVPATVIQIVTSRSSCCKVYCYHMSAYSICQSVLDLLVGRSARANWDSSARPWVNVHVLLAEQLQQLQQQRLRSSGLVSLLLTLSPIKSLLGLNHLTNREFLIKVV